MTQKKNILGALILAAGKGTRMYSEKPKVLQTILGEPMLSYVYKAINKAGIHSVWTVIGHGADAILKEFPEQKTNFILQNEQLGTGHALQTAWQNKDLQQYQYLLVINGDTPLLPAQKLEEFATNAIEAGCALAFMSLTLDNPMNFGRVLRKKGQVAAIIEAKDFDKAQHGEEPNEINAGIYCLNMEKIAPLLCKLQNTNKSGEFYITDLIGLAVAEGLKVEAINQGNCPELLGVNDPFELTRSEEILRASIVESFARQGVIIRSPSTVRLGIDVQIEKGASLTGPLEIYGHTKIARGVEISANCVIYSAKIGKNTKILPFTHIEQAEISADCSVGPYARLRPQAVLGKNVKVGNFVEIKKSTLHEGAKASHLSYIGDADIGAEANIGAGTITCNYDGKNKYKTHIGQGAFIGSNTALVAPVTVGANAIVGAGSVITKDIPDNYLGVGRAKQVNLEYQRKK